MRNCKKCFYCELTQGSELPLYFCRHPDQQYIQAYFRNTNINPKLAGFLGIVQREEAPEWCPFHKKGAAQVVQ